MLDAQEDYVAGGGRLIYMGGNGYYWVVGFDSEMPACMEVRKLDSGIARLGAKPGEHYLANHGKKAGFGATAVARRKSLPASALSPRASRPRLPIRKMPDAWHRTVSWITEGVEGENLWRQGPCLQRCGRSRTRSVRP